MQEAPLSARTRLQELGPTARRRVLWGALGAVLLLVSAMALGQAERVQASLVADATTSAEALGDAALAPVLKPTAAAAPTLAHSCLAASPPGPSPGTAAALRASTRTCSGRPSPDADGPSAPM